jgi:hypothetical protein
MRVEILGEERRRRWGDDRKLDIVMSVGSRGFGDGGRASAQGDAATDLQ